MSLAPTNTCLPAAAAVGDGSDRVPQAAEPTVADPAFSPSEEGAVPAADQGLGGLLEKPSPDPDSRPAELQWTNIDLKEARNASALSSSAIVETSSLNAFGSLSVGGEDHYGSDEHPLWAWVSGGGCFVDSHISLKWFMVQSGT